MPKVTLKIIIKVFKSICLVGKSYLPLIFIDLFLLEVFLPYDHYVCPVGRSVGWSHLKELKHQFITQFHSFWRPMKSRTYFFDMFSKKKKLMSCDDASFAARQGFDLPWLMIAVCSSMIKAERFNTKSPKSTFDMFSVLWLHCIQLCRFDCM